MFTMGVTVETHLCHTCPIARSTPRTSYQERFQNYVSVSVSDVTGEELCLCSAHSKSEKRGESSALKEQRERAPHTAPVIDTIGVY